MTNRKLLLENIADQLIDMPEYGQIQIFVRSHLGMIGKVDIVKMTTTKYEDNDPNVSVVADIFSMIKGISDASISGSLGFSVNFKHGVAETMQVQDFQRLT